jgi:hypothetical protein
MNDKPCKHRHTLAYKSSHGFSLKPFCANLKVLKKTFQCDTARDESILSFIPLGMIPIDNYFVCSDCLEREKD